MNWKTKSTIQNLVSKLPESISYKLYYFLQRNFGSLKKNKINPITGLSAGIEICKRINQVSYSTVNATFLELGTGWRINTPIAFWLLGAKKVITIDINPYLKEELVKGDLEYIRKNSAEIEQLFCGEGIFIERLNFLLGFIESSYNISDILKICNIEYIPFADATQLKLSSHSIDFYITYNVLEHIPRNIIQKILEERNRIIKEKGLYIDKIDYSDHFAHSDNSISLINFLQFTDSRWNKIAGNSYMYMNRLRHDDFINLFSLANHRILLEEINIDSQLIDLIKSKRLQLDKRFSSKSESVLATTGSWFVSQYHGGI